MYWTTAAQGPRLLLFTAQRPSLTRTTPQRLSEVLSAMGFPSFHNTPHRLSHIPRAPRLAPAAGPQNRGHAPPNRRRIDSATSQPAEANRALRSSRPCSKMCCTTKLAKGCRANASRSSDAGVIRHACQGGGGEGDRVPLFDNPR